MRTVGQFFRRLLWMFKVKDCRHVCLFCEHYHICTIDGATERRGEEMNMKYAMRSEDTEQIAVIQWAQYNVNHHPELKWLHHCPNGGSRNRLEAVKLKQMGVKAGVSDLCLPYPKGIYCPSGWGICAPCSTRKFAKGISCGHGSSRTLRRNLLFRRGGNHSHYGIFEPCGQKAHGAQRQNEPPE